MGVVVKQCYDAFNSCFSIDAVFLRNEYYISEVNNFMLTKLQSIIGVCFVCCNVMCREYLWYLVL